MNDIERHDSGILDARQRNALAGAPSFTLSHRILRCAWIVTWTLLARWTPPPLHRWRVILLNLFGAKVAPNAHVYASARIWYPPNLEMKAHASLAPGVDCYCMAPVTIGEYAVVSQRAYLCAGDHDVDDPSFQLIARPIVIGAHAWVAAEAFVGPGVEIGEGAVLGARAVAAGNLDAWTVYAGNPARRLRTRAHSDPVAR